MRISGPSHHHHQHNRHHRLSFLFSSSLAGDVPSGVECAFACVSPALQVAAPRGHTHYKGSGDAGNRGPTSGDAYIRGGRGM